MAKGPSSKNPTGGAEKQEARRKRLEARRQAKAEAYARARRAQARERFVRYVLIAFVAAAFIWFIFLRTQTPTEFDGIAVRQFSTAGVNQHTSDPVTYESSPPVSGQHAPGVIPCGVYAQPIPDETQVHMLEHGAIGIQFLPNLPQEQIDRIQGIVARQDENVFSAPYTDMTTPIAVTSWSRMITMDEVNATAIQEYIDAFAGDGPESGTSCPNEQDSPFEQPSAQPSATAEPTPSPTEKDDKGKGKKDSG